MADNVIHTFIKIDFVKSDGKKASVRFRLAIDVKPTAVTVYKMEVTPDAD